MDSITIDGMEEMEFRRSIESMLRHGQADDAAQKLRTLLEGYAGEGRILPERFLTVSSDDLCLEGWEKLGDKLGEYDRPEAAMSAISIDILDPQGVGARPDPQGFLKPVIETSYFSDSAWPFSEAGREDLLDGYSSFGCEWQGNFENVDTTVSVEGIDDLYGAAVGLENKVASGGDTGIEDICAGSVGSCFLAVLIHQAVRDAVREKGLPRPICVLAGSNDAYPFFDAPAMTIDEYRQDCNFASADENAPISRIDDEFDDDDGTGTARVGGMASLEGLTGMTGKKKEKKPVIMIDPSEADTVETLEMPDPAMAEAEERQHIMPSLELGAGPPPEPAEPPSEDELTPQSDAEPTEWDQNEPVVPTVPTVPAVPVEFGAQDQPTPIDFSAYGAPAPTDREEHKHAAPVNFISSEPPLPHDLEAQEPSAPLDLGAYESQPPDDDGEQEPPAPLDRLSSENAIPESASPEPEMDPVGDGWDQEELGDSKDWPAPADWGGDLDMPGFPVDPPVDEVPSAGPTEQVGFDDRSAVADPFEIDQFASPDEPSPKGWASAYDLPTADETGDNLPRSVTAPDSHDEPRMEEPRPARHSIRVIAASVTNDRNAGSAKHAASGESPILRLIFRIGAALVWLRNRITGR